MASSTCASSMSSGGSRRTVVGPGGVEHEPLLEQRAHDHVGCARAMVRIELAGDHQPAPADLDDARQLGQRVAQALAQLAHARQQRSSSMTSSDRERRAAHAPGRRRTSSRGRRARRRRPGARPVTSAPIGSPPPRALATVIASGTTPESLVGPQRAGAPHAASGPRRRSAPRRARRTPRARRAARPRRARRRRSRPGPARAAPPRSASSTAAAIASRRRLDRDEARHQRRERRLLGLLRRGRQRAVRAAVEAAVHDDDRRRRGLRLARELDRRLVGLGAGVGEVHLAAQRATRPAAAASRSRRLGVEEVADVHQRARPARGSPRPRAGWQCPRLLTAMPVRKSRYSLPSSSHRRAPSPRTNSTGRRA